MLTIVYSAVPTTPLIVVMLTRVALYITILQVAVGDRNITLPTKL
jgi:hypothetical protein